MKQGRSLKEAKAERAEKKRKAKRRKRALVLIVEIGIFMILLGIGYVMTQYEKLQLHTINRNNIVINEGVNNEGYTTIALFGGDSTEGKLEAGTHADTIIVVSIHNETKEVRLVSVYRDLLTVQADEKIKKANNAYFSQGPEAAINMLNQNFDLDIQDYVTVDFSAVAKAVDLLGGIEVDVTEAEAAEMNRHIVGTAEVVGKQSELVESGLQTLDGVQTVAYSRIRKNLDDGDYGRTRRQRDVIQKLAEKIKQTDLNVVNDIINQVFPNISTSFELSELLELASGFAKYEVKDTHGYPFNYTDGTIEGIGSVVIPLNVVENIKELHEFLYPGLDYIISESAKEYSVLVENKIGE